MIWLLFLLQISKDPAVVAQGEKIFAHSCSVGYCHGAAGAPARGPRLRGRTFDNNYLYKVIRDGIPKSAMPAWRDRLKVDEIWATVSYVQSLGTESEAAASTAAPAPVTQSSVEVPAAAARGMELFFESKGCGSCHALGGRGTVVGPDISRLPAEKLAAAIHATQSSHVRLVKLKDGETFPALVGAEEGGFVRVFDLTEPPPVSRTLEKAEIESIAPGNWSHQSVIAAYTPEQLADIGAYVRYYLLHHN